MEPRQKSPAGGSGREGKDCGETRMSHNCGFQCPFIEKMGKGSCQSKLNWTGKDISETEKENSGVLRSPEDSIRGFSRTVRRHPGEKRLESKRETRRAGRHTRNRLEEIV